MERKSYDEKLKSFAALQNEPLKPYPAKRAMFVGGRLSGEVIEIDDGADTHVRHMRGFVEEYYQANVVSLGGSSFVIYLHEELAEAEALMKILEAFRDKEGNREVPC